MEIKESFFDTISSPEMRAYIISQLDPYHDSDYRVVGAPSSLNANSVVININSEETYSAASLGITVVPGAGNKFDVNIASFPISGQIRMFPTRPIGPLAFDNAALNDKLQARYMYPLTLSACPVGEDTYTFDENDTLNPPDWRGIEANPLIYADPAGKFRYRRARLISMAFEVVDETPSIYRQGSCTVYKQASSTQELQVWLKHIVTPSVMTVHGAFPATDITLPPTTQAKAARLPGSRTWLAAKGAYVISEKTVEEVPFKSPDYRIPLLTGEDDGSVQNFNTYVGENVKYYYNDEPASYLTPPNGAGESIGCWPYSTSGAYFTGLSAEFAVLRVRFRQIWEVIPDSADTTLVPLSTPTLPRDSLVEQLIQEAFAKAPSGYMQTENPSGEVWRKALSNMGRIMTDSSSLFSSLSPELSLVLRGGGSALSAGSRLGASSKKKKPKKGVTATPRPTPKQKAKTGK
jgi:hypothetical protein